MVGLYRAVGCWVYDMRTVYNNIRMDSRITFMDRY